MQFYQVFTKNLAKWLKKSFIKKSGSKLRTKGFYEPALKITDQDI